MKTQPPVPGFMNTLTFRQLVFGYGWVTTVLTITIVPGALFSGEYVNAFAIYGVLMFLAWFLFMAWGIGCRRLGYE